MESKDVGEKTFWWRGKKFTASVTSGTLTVTPEKGGKTRQIDFQDAHREAWDKGRGVVCCALVTLGFRPLHEEPPTATA